MAQSPAGQDRSPTVADGVATAAGPGLDDAQEPGVADAPAATLTEDAVADDIALDPAPPDDGGDRAAADDATEDSADDSGDGSGEAAGRTRRGRHTRGPRATRRRPRDRSRPAADDAPDEQPDARPDEPPATGPLIETTAVARPRWLFPIRILQVATWEALALIVVAGHGWNRPAILAPAVVVLLATSVRWRGLTGLGWPVTFVEFRRRQRRRRSRPDAGPLAAALGRVELVDNVDRAGNRIGIVHVADGCSALIRAAPYGNTSVATLLTALDTALARTDVPLHAVQLLVRGALGADGKPLQVHWLAVHFRPDEAPQAVLARGGGPEGARKATATAALLLARDLADAGCPVSMLNATEVRHDLLVTLGADLGTGGEGTSVQETWRSWSIGTGRQACHRVVATVPAETLRRIIAGAAFVCSSLTRRRSGRDELVIRVADRPQLTWMTDSQRPSDAFTTHGQQDRYVRRSLPLALD